jgi:hypothetical protein
MKTIYILKTSENGVMPYAFSSIIALYNYLANEYSQMDTIFSYNGDVKLTYDSFVNEINKNGNSNNFMHPQVCYLFESEQRKITAEILELSIKSK